MNNNPPIFSVAPMMAWTDRHCRFFHRLFSAKTRLYSEMITAKAVIHGAREALLGYLPCEHPIALQLGGSVPDELAKASEIATEFGYDEVNLNCGCPSARVQAGEFGAALMRRPGAVYAMLKAMRGATSIPISVKCRIGVDDDDETLLPIFLDHVRSAGVTQVIIHARKAWLKGLSPKDNRAIPPLDYAVVYKMKREFPNLHITLNGGITTLKAAKAHLDAGFDGVMVGRAAYHSPHTLLGDVERVIFSDHTHAGARDEDIIARMADYINDYCNRGGRVHNVTRHMLGLFNARPGARAWRRFLSETPSERREKMQGDILYAAFEAQQKAATSHEYA